MHASHTSLCVCMRVCVCVNGPPAQNTCGSSLRGKFIFIVMSCHDR